MLKKFLCSLFPVVALICIVNVAFLYVYSNGDRLADYNRSQAKASNFPRSIKQIEDSSNQVKIQEKQLQIIYYKTHKTASTTVGSILFRLGAHHGARFFPAKGHYYLFGKLPNFTADITLNHHEPLKSYSDMMAHYKKIVPNGKFLTVLREPTRRYLSSYHYFVQPDGKDFAQFLKDPKWANGIAQDIGIWEEGELERFMKYAYEKFTFLITEMLDESLLLLKNEWGWTLQDILYIKLNDACKKGINYARKPMSCRPQYENLTAAQIEEMRSKNAMDMALYERAMKDMTEALASQPASFWSELATYKQMLRELQTVCTQVINGTYPAMCKPYYMGDTTYEALIREGNGRVDNFPPFSVSFK